MTRVEIWDRQNSTRLGIASAASAVLTRAIARGESLSVSLAATDRAVAHLSEGAVLRVQTEGDADDFTLWRISSVGESRSEQDAHTMKIEADALWMDLRHGRVRQAQADGTALFAFGLVGMTPLTWIEDIILPWADADGLVFQVGTVEAGSGVDLSFESASPIAALRMLEQATRGELQFRYSADGQTCYVDLLQRIGQSEGASELRYGKNIRGLERTVDYSEVATRLYAKGGGALTLADATWEIASKSGTQITFADKSPVFEDGAFVGLWFYVEGKGAYLITASSAVAGTINVDGAGLSAGDVGYIATDAAGARMAYLESPSGRDKFGVAVGDLAATDIPDATNLVLNGDLSEWAGALPDGWTAEGGAVVSKATDPLYSKYGETAARVVGSDAGDGMLSPAFTVSKPAARPCTGMLAGLTVVSGRVRAELRHSNGNIYPVAEQPGSEGLGVYLTLKAGPVHDEPLPDGTAQIAIVAHGGPAEWYLDTAMVTPQIGGDVPEFVANSGAWLLWDRTAEELAYRAREKRAYQVALADLYRIDPARFRFDELGLGDDARVRDPDFGAETLRIMEITEDLLRPERTRLVVAADPWSRPPDEISEVLPRYGQSRSFKWTDAGKKNTAYILSADAQYDPADDKVYVRALGSAAVATIELRTKATRTAAYPVGAEQVLNGREGTFAGVVLPASDSLYAQVAGLDGRGVAGPAVEVSLRDVGDTLSAELADLQQELTDLDTEIRGAFDGGEITSVEAIAIAEAQKQFDAEHADAEASTASLLANSALAGTPKTNLSDAWAAYDTDFDDLIAAIAAIVTDGLLPEEKTAYEDAYTAYQGTLATLSTRRQDALDAISQARALTVQYASDDQGSNSSSTFDPAIHAFMRQSTDGGATWTDWFRIVGENGASSEGRYVDYIFAVAETQPATPTGEAPAGWFDAPPAYDPATGLKLWLSRADRDGADDSLLSAWSVPVQITGPEGPGSPPVSNLRLDPALETTTHFALRYDTADEVEQMWEAAEVFDGDKPTEAMIDDVRDDIVENTLMSNVLMIPKPDEGRLAVAWLQPVAYDAEGHSIDMGGVHYVVVGTAAPFEFDVQFDESPDGTQAVLSVDVDDPRGVVTGVDVWLTTGGVETGPFAALEAGAVFSYAFLLHEHHVTPVRAAINRSDVSTPLPLGPWTADSNKVPAMPEVREERVGSTATLLVDAPDTDTTALYFKTDDGAGGLGAETSIEARGSDPRFGSFEVIADSTVQRFRVYGKNESGLAGPYRDVRVDPLTAGQPSPPDAWIYPAPGEVHNDADLAVQFGATVGAGSTGPLEWQLVIVIGDGAFDWPATWESLSLPRISIIARHARRVTSAYFRVKDGNGLITEASPYRLPPVMDGIGPTGLVDPIVPMEDGTGVFRKSLPGDPDDFDTIPDRATGGTYRKPKLGDVSTGGRIVRVRDETSGVDYTGEAVGEGVDRATAGLDSIGDVRRTVPLPRLTPVLPDVNVSSGRVTGFEGEGGLARKSDVDLGTVEVTNKKLDFIDDTVTFRKPGSGYVDGSGRVSAIFDTGVGVLRDGGQVGSGVSRANAGLNSSGDVNRNVPTTRVRGVTDPITEVPYTGTELGEGYDRAVGGLDSAGVVKKGVPVTHVSGFTGQGALATADNADDVPDGSTKRVTTTSEANGGGKADETLVSTRALHPATQIDALNVARGIRAGALRHTNEAVFDPVLPQVPAIIFGQGGIGAAPTQTREVQALNLSESGFTLHAMIRDTTISLDPESVTFTGTDAAKPNAAEAYNDTYTFQYDVTVAAGLQDPKDPSGPLMPSSISLVFWTNDGSGWVPRAARTHSNDTASARTLPNLGLTVTVAGMDACPGFRITIDSTEGGVSTVNRDSVSWQVGSASSPVSMTPAGSSDIPYIAMSGT